MHAASRSITANGQTLLLMLLIQFVLPVLAARRPLASHSIPQLRDGPCRLLNNGMRCTADGYFELVQCDKSSCFCVKAHSGEIAYETRTLNPKTAPHCSICYNKLAELYERGQPPNGSYIPICDNRKGHFQEVQCTAERDVCFCVDQETGKEFKSTKTRVRGGSAVIRCDEKDPSTEPTKMDKALIPIASPSCRLPADRGSYCSGYNPTIQYWFDAETFSCLAFEYKGCGGNGNRFPTDSECWQSCMFADAAGCAGMKPPARNAKGEPAYCSPLHFIPRLVTILAPASLLPDKTNMPLECPTGSKCVIDTFRGLCCDAENEELYEKNRQPICRNGKPAFKKNEYATLLGEFCARNVECANSGKSCSHNFCPRGTSCFESEMFAHCC